MRSGLADYNEWTIIILIGTILIIKARTHYETIVQIWMSQFVHDSVVCFECWTTG